MGIDIEIASEGRFSKDIMALYADWSEFRQWASTTSFDGAGLIKWDSLEAVSPFPSQSFCIGLNYRSHAEEAGWQVPEVPVVFTKFPSSISGPGSAVELTGASVDWEVELVVVIGQRARRVSPEDAWSYVAGLTIGQDISDRDTQKRPRNAPQHSLGKSHPGYAPIGPVLVSPEEFSNPNSIRLGCSVNDVIKQDGCTDDLIFSIPELIAYLSEMLPLMPGDVIFTGTPSGIGSTRTPAQFLLPGDRVTSWVEGVGEMTNTFVSGPGVRV
ncbi:fumarylacetoacetate hydrolase family protein [Arthrobacter sulfonylureivorans]|uniref:Fumarylacetoacetate hydrolase family protein n=1 Tax=Arthrobacter sulfonylureivorans TaxID=2486855 RepID=A0ABY3WD38_9MICC|nr:fumarylacetoacetate hydrolase family protein [Arthrobacter sulfonylureivorans]UNK47118.1 fumarylacetoacetate hydrolase family protein [Arthrobacter sulfonylureivorans]